VDFQVYFSTPKACLKFDRIRKGLVAYKHSDFAADLDKRRSLNGYMFTVDNFVMS
jgi:hypothetical protein